MVFVCNMTWWWFLGKILSWSTTLILNIQKTLISSTIYKWKAINKDARKIWSKIIKHFKSSCIDMQIKWFQKKLVIVVQVLN